MTALIRISWSNFQESFFWPKNNTQTTVANNAITNNVKTILEEPTAEEFLCELRIKSPDLYSKLLKRSSKFKKRGMYLEQYVQERIVPLYRIPSMKNANFINQEWEIENKNYKNYALFSDGKLREYDRIMTNDKNSQFLWYGIVWTHKAS